MKFYRVSHNSFTNKGFPWVNHIQTGLYDKGSCQTCGVHLYRPEGDIQVTFEPRKGSKWPDILGCGAYPLFIISSRTIEALQEKGIGNLYIGKVKISSSIPSKLPSHRPPDYFWVDGHKLHGTELDFDASGFIGVKFCPECNNRTHNIGATHDRQHSGNWPLAFKKGSWNGLQLFTTDLSPTTFFCTETIVEVAHTHKLTNFRFVPTTEGNSTEHPGVQYLR